MIKIGFSVYERIVRFLSLPVFVLFFLNSSDAQYRIGVLKRLRLIWQFRRNTRRIKTASDWREHLTMAAKILEIPRSIEGDVIECGCYKGGSTANLSLICQLVGRRLLVFDSFEGLPQPDESDRIHEMDVSGRVIEYEKGQYTGRLDEVRHNVSAYGALDVCEFCKGYFKSTLPKLDRKIVFAFVDVDLRESLEDCLRELWPRLQDGCLLFSHEAQVVPYVAKFFDTAWWISQLNTPPPGFVGAGIGLPVVGIRQGSQIGYTRKPIPNLDGKKRRKAGALKF
jgi:O-methyltransferase